MKKPLKSTFPEKPATYIIKDPISGTFYIGSTGNLGKRLSNHRASFNQGNHENPNLQEIFNLNPMLEIEYEIKESREIAAKNEQQLLDEYFANKLNLNRSEVTHGRSSNLITDAEKEATRQRSLGNTYCLGRVLSEESKQKISDARKGIQFSDDHKQKLSEKKANPVIIDGIEYHNCVKAAEALEIPINRVQQRVKSKTFTTWIRKKDIENVT